MPTTRSNDTIVRWAHSALALTVVAPEDGPPRLVHLGPGRGDDPGDNGPPGQPLVELRVAGQGGTWSGTRSVGTSAGQRLRYTGHREIANGAWSELHITSQDEFTGLSVDVVFSTVDGLPAVRTWTRVRAAGDQPVTLHAVSSFAATSFPSGVVTPDDLELYRGRNDWLGEGAWSAGPLRPARLPDLDLSLHDADPRGCVAAVSQGSWSTGASLPNGVLVDRVTHASLAWQVEHNGAWRWEVGESRAGVYLFATGPTDLDHQWQHVLEPGDEFVSVPVALAASDEGMPGAVAAMTTYRRSILRPHPARDTLPVVFNDYMNTLMGDPSTARLLPLIDAAAGVGAEYFCIDAGWYGDGDWWDAVGAWEPSDARFPGGLSEVIEHIRGAGMVPGLWLEPEVVGVRSPVAERLPDEAFFQRGGRRQIEHGRYHLDFRHPAAAAHLTSVVDRLVDEMGVGYFKLDYNINPGVGTEVKASAPGDGLLGHNRAFLAWLDDILDRHPGLVIENCASGAMRMDYAMLSRLHLQSTSDQRDPLRYAPIAAAAPMSILPEQAGNWAYPQPEMSAEQMVFTLVTGLAGRLYLTGHLNRMTAEQAALVRQAVTLHRDIRHQLATAVPVWPLGLPRWDDPWVALGLETAGDDTDSTYVAVWRRDSSERDISLELPHLKGRAVHTDVVFPANLPGWELTWDSQLGVLSATTDGPEPTARLIKLTATRL
ncbi:glycoside hydrolase family 36 protein [Phytoactinopolyspora mesophila]|uniref:glycoside hydrolase family 36 protein n=1 Tax=Phytoactinopolyspora mesophila TaxID=2650750 RepID=UPI001C9E96FB